MSKTYKVTVDTKTFIRFWLVILGFILGGLLVLQASGGLLIIGAALFFALAINPLVRKLAKLIPGEGMKLPIAIAYLIVVGFLVAFLAIVVPTVINETVNFARNMPDMVKSVSNNFSWINDFGANFGIENLLDQILNGIRTVSADIVNNFSSNFANSIGTFGSIIASLILIFVLALLMLTEGRTILDHFWKTFRGAKKAERARNAINRMGEVVSKYVSNALTVALINACFTSIAALIICLCFHLDLGLALPFGLITGVFSLIPMFGSFIGGAIVALLLAFNAWGAGLAFIIYTIIYLQIESNLISPKIQGKGLQLPALVVLASVTIGVFAFGIVGAIVSIPIAGCIKVLLEEYSKTFERVEEAIEKEEKAEEKKLIAEKA